MENRGSRKSLCPHLSTRSPPTEPGNQTMPNGAGRADLFLQVNMYRGFPDTCHMRQFQRRHAYQRMW